MSKEQEKKTSLEESKEVKAPKTKDPITRQLMWILQQFLQAASSAFFLQADSCYRDALRIYGSLQEKARNRVPGAEPLFCTLQTLLSREVIRYQSLLQELILT
jgi:hypothetical protein